MNSSDKKSKFLGIPYGTANARLRKSILFHLLVRFELNQCYRCSESILGIDDLSIEHKKPWENVSVDLFWDLDNIAFSHLACNSRAGKKTRKGQQAPHGSNSRYTYWKCRCEDCRLWNRKRVARKRQQYILLAQLAEANALEAL